MSALVIPILGYTIGVALLLISFATLINLLFLTWQKFSWDRWGRKATERAMLKERGREDD